MIRKITHLKTALLLAAGLFTITTFGQNNPVKKFGPKLPVVKCATTEYESYLQQKSAKRFTTPEFEAWIAPKIQESKASGFLKNGQTTNQVVTIPVVFHVIHNGSAIGSEENISDEQILSQITVLNQDYRRMADTPGYNENPVGADMEIEFCLAQRDPNGFATSGITRHYIPTDDVFGWEMNAVEENIKPQTQWDPTKYLNIWVVSNVYISYMGIPIGELAGYAQFPTQSGLDGIEGEEEFLAETDGVVLGHLYCGSSEIYPEGTYDQFGGRDKGRTATHETGHYFGLRHIWGDGNCSVDDFCEDTPVTAYANSGCPEDQDSCPSSPGLDMIENYMDYTNDSCQNVFTQNQKDRMQAVLANSPRRASLITSDGCQQGVSYDIDGSLNLLNPSLECDGTMNPSFLLYNGGTEPITSATINVALNGTAIQTIQWTGNIAVGETATITGENSFQPAIGSYTLTATLTTINENEDENTSNNVTSLPIVIENIPNADTEEIIVTITTDDDGDEIGWAIYQGTPNLNSDEDPYYIGAEGEYDDNQTYTTTVTVDPNQCYTFVMLDMGGDGLETGGYSVTSSGGEVLAEGDGNFSFLKMSYFGVGITLDNEEFNATLQQIKLYPNPVNNIVNIAMPNNELPESYTIFNNLGQVVAQAKVSSQSNLSIDASSYSNGIYFVKVEKNGQSTTLKFVKQ